MAENGRNDPCSCGSALKTKRCCGVERGPSADELAAARLAEACRQVAPMLAGWDEADFATAGDAALELPRRYTALQAPLPRLWGPALDRLGQAVSARGPESELAEAALWAVVDELDTPRLRERLALAALGLAEDGDVEPELAAVTVLMLREDPDPLLAASVLQAIAVACGVERTPRGLMVAGR